MKQLKINQENSNCENLKLAKTPVKVSTKKSRLENSSRGSNIDVDGLLDKWIRFCFATAVAVTQIFEFRFLGRDFCSWDFVCKAKFRSINGDDVMRPYLNITIEAVGENKVCLTQWSKNFGPYWCCIIVCIAKITVFHNETVFNGIPLCSDVAR